MAEAPKPASDEEIALMKEKAASLVAEYGAIKSEALNGPHYCVRYTNGYACVFKPNGSRQEKRPDVTLMITKAGVPYIKVDGKYVVYEAEASPKASPKKASPKSSPKAAPKTQPAKRKRPDTDESSSDSSSSASTSSSDSDEITNKKRKSAPKKASPKSSPKKAAKKAAKRASKPAAKRTRKVVDSDDEVEKEPEEEIDINDDDRATLAMIALAMAPNLDLSDAAAAEAARLKAEAEKNRKPPRRPTKQPFPSSIDALKTKISKLKEMIRKQESTLSIKDESKEVSLSTSLTNYIDPRVVCAWCQRENVGVNQIYNKTLQAKFPWAINIDPDWRF